LLHLIRVDPARHNRILECDSVWGQGRYRVAVRLA